MRREHMRYRSPVNTPSPEAWVGGRFRHLRKERGMSQQEAVNRMAAFGYTWSQATMTRLEAATRPTTLNEIATLGAIYGVKLADLLDGIPDIPLRCHRCGEHGPAEGFTCNTCGRSGA